MGRTEVDHTFLGVKLIFDRREAAELAVALDGVDVVEQFDLNLRTIGEQQCAAKGAHRLIIVTHSQVALARQVVDLPIAGIVVQGHLEVAEGRAIIAAGIVDQPDLEVGGGVVRVKVEAVTKGIQCLIVVFQFHQDIAEVEVGQEVTDKAGDGTKLIGGLGEQPAALVVESERVMGLREVGIASDGLTVRVNGLGDAVRALKRYAALKVAHT